MSRRRTILAVATVTLLCAAVLALGAPLPVWLRTALAVPFTLLLPGAAALLAWDAADRLGRLEWFALALGTSTAFTILAGMLVAATVGLAPQRVTDVIAVATTLMLFVAWRRAPRAETGGEPRLVWVRPAMALALSAGALLVLALSVPRSLPADGGTVQLWAEPDASGGVRVSARNLDAPSRRYHLLVEQGGGRITRQALDMPVGAERVFEVRASATWTRSAPVTAVLTDDSGVLAPRSISVWPAQ